MNCIYCDSKTEDEICTASSYEECPISDYRLVDNKYEYLYLRINIVYNGKTERLACSIRNFHDFNIYHNEFRRNVLEMQIDTISYDKNQLFKLVEECKSKIIKILENESLA